MIDITDETFFSDCHVQLKSILHIEVIEVCWIVDGNPLRGPISIFQSFPAFVSLQLQSNDGSLLKYSTFCFRLNPTVPVTIHQKALFLFWISCLIIFLAFCVMALLQKLMNANIKYKDIHANGDDAENKSDIFLEKSSKRPGTHLLKERSPATGNAPPQIVLISNASLTIAATKEPHFVIYQQWICLHDVINQLCDSILTSLLHFAILKQADYGRIYV